MRARRPADSDERLVARAGLRVGLVTAALVALVVVALAVVLGVAVVHQQASSDRALVDRTLQTATSTDAPPPGTTVTLVTGGRYVSSPGLPAGLPDVRALVAAVSAGRTTRETVHLQGRHLLVETRPRAGGAAQVAFDLRAEDRLRRTVAVTTAVVGAIGLVAAAAVAVVVARRAVRPLASALRLQRSFVADASHELRTPLTLLTTRAQLLRRSAERGDTAQLATDAAGLVTDAGRLSDVVDDLLLAADPRRDLERAPVELHALAAEVVAAARPFAAERGTALVLAGSAVRCAVNETAVRRAVLALVDNALAHTPAGGTVTVETAGGRTATVAVSDTGPGVAAADAQRVFERFRSGDQGASRRSYGLGLALVRDVAARHGGTVRVAPSDVGARFVLELPLR